MELDYDDPVIQAALAEIAVLHVQSWVGRDEGKYRPLAMMPLMTDQRGSWLAVQNGAGA